MRALRVLLLFVLLAGMLSPALVLGADTAPPPQPTLALPTDQVWTLIAGVLSPIAAYALNFRGPWISERVKVLVQIVVAAVVGGITQAITAGGVGFNGRTLQFVITAIFAALGAHFGIWRASGISTAVGGGRNATDGKPEIVLPRAPG